MKRSPGTIARHHTSGDIMTTIHTTGSIRLTLWDVLSIIVTGHPARR